MEVSVSSTSGLPEGCVLSVRAGSTRRQAPVPLAEPLRFPSLPFNAKQFKVDVLQALGTARLDIDAANSVESYTVDLDLLDELGKATGRASVALTVREEPALCGKRACELKQVDRSMRSSDVSSVAGVEPAEQSRPGTTSSLAAQQSSDGQLKAMRDTRDYAQAHNIPNLVQEMLQNVLRERPANPFSVMAEHFRRLAE